MKRFIVIIVVLAVVFSSLAPTKPANADGNGWVIGGALLGGFLLGSILGPHEIIVGPVYPAYPPPHGYYPPPVYYPLYYQPQAVWIPDHYEWCEVTVCPQGYCYRTQVQMVVPGHWEYR